MDVWRYFEVTHSRHDLLNPSRPETMSELGEALRLRPGLLVLDVACGHAEMLLRWHELFGIKGLGVDASPYHSRRAKERVAARAPEALEVRQARGEDLELDERFDVACCLGASWIWKGHRGTLEALAGFAKPGGAVVVGEPYWKAEPDPGYLRAEGCAREDFLDLEGCRRAALGLGFELVWMRGSSLVEWDEYEMLQNVALDAFARVHPDDPDLSEMRAKRRMHDEAYFRWGRDCLGWAIWAFRAPGGGGPSD
jgi:SAM-dependent methyltransferase